jgi:hypothetical protein
MLRQVFESCHCGCLFAVMSEPKLFFQFAFSYFLKKKRFLQAFSCFTDFIRGKIGKIELTLGGNQMLRFHIETVNEENRNVTGPVLEN